MRQPEGRLLQRPPGSFLVVGGIERQRRAARQQREAGDGGSTDPKGSYEGPPDVSALHKGAVQRQSRRMVTDASQRPGEGAGRGLSLFEAVSTVPSDPARIEVWTGDRISYLPISGDSRCAARWKSKHTSKSANACLPEAVIFSEQGRIGSRGRARTVGNGCN